jgi:hypothetical protein
VPVAAWLRRRGSYHSGQGGLFSGAWPALDTALSIPVEHSGPGLVEAVLSQLRYTLLAAQFSNALGVLVVTALDQLACALNIIICGCYVHAG